MYELHPLTFEVHGPTLKKMSSKCVCHYTDMTYSGDVSCMTYHDRFLGTHRDDRKLVDRSVRDRLGPKRPREGAPGKEGSAQGAGARLMAAGFGRS